jgi:PIN domain nuclease of toxin-antitoxin system
MEALLDTHALVWWFEDARTLSGQAAKILAGPNNMIHVSAAVAWELAIKVNLGKFRYPELVRDLGDLIEQEGWVQLPISLEHASRAGLLPLHHRDPFDRMLVAQAQALNLPILSADRALDEYDVQRVW